MNNVEELADTFGFTIAIGKDSTRFGTSAKRVVHMIPDPSPKGGLDVTIKPVIETAYHELHNGLSILAGTLVGDLGFLVYNSQVDGIDCVDLALFDKKKLGFKIERYFEKNAQTPVSTLASDFDTGLICQVRRMTRSKKYTLIDDRRVLKGKTNDADSGEVEKPTDIRPDDGGVVANETA